MTMFEKFKWHGPSQNFEDITMHATAIQSEAEGAYNTRFSNSTTLIIL